MLSHIMSFMKHLQIFLSHVNFICFWLLNVKNFIRKLAHTFFDIIFNVIDFDSLVKINLFI